MSTQSGLAASCMEWNSHGYSDPYTINAMTIRRMRYKLGLTPPAWEPAAVARLLRHHSTPLQASLRFGWATNLLKKDGFALSVQQKIHISVLPLSVNFLVTHDTKSYQILGRVIVQSAPRLNVMDLKILRAPTRLATLAISLEDFAAMLEIKFRSNSHRPVPTPRNCEE